MKKKYIAPKLEMLGKLSDLTTQALPYGRGILLVVIL